MISRRVLRTAIYFLLLPVPATPVCAAQPAQKPSAPQLEALAGNYSDPAEPGGGYTISVQDGKLILESTATVPTELVPVSGTVFGAPGLDKNIEFHLDASGAVQSIVFSDKPNVVYRRTGEPVRQVFHDYVRSEAMIPMRDGVKLHAVILRPTDIATPLPILMQRTPYGVDGTNRSSFFAQRPELARDGYIYVAEDIRGRYKSEGNFVMMRSLADHRDPQAIDESTDTYDTVDWLIKNVASNNGRVGVVGTSYPGFLAMMAGIDPHPAVKAISPQAPMIDVWIGDDFFHNGAFRQSYGYDYVLGLESTKTETGVSYGNIDGFDYFLRRGSFSQDVKQSGSRVLPTWKLFLDHPAYDSAWSSRAVEYALNSVTLPTLTVAAITTRKTCSGRRRSTRSSSLTTPSTRTFSFSGRGATVTGRPRRSTWATWTTVSRSAPSSAAKSRRNSSRISSKTSPASISTIRQASRPARIPGSTTRIFRHSNRGQPRSTSAAGVC